MIRNIDGTSQTTNRSEKKVLRIFKKAFQTNRTFENADFKNKLKPGQPPLSQKTRPKPYRVKNYVGKELNKTNPIRTLEKIHNVEENCFVFPVVISLKTDKPVKIAFDSTE